MPIADLDANLNGSIGKYKFYNDVKYDRETSTLTLIAQYDYQNTKLDDLIGCITEGNKSSNLNFNHSSKWTKVGVAAKIHEWEDLHRHHSAGKDDLTCPFSP